MLHRGYSRYALRCKKEILERCYAPEVIVWHRRDCLYTQQHTLFVTHPNDFVGQMDACFVAYTRDGMISRIYEYFDSGQMDKFLPPRSAA